MDNDQDNVKDSDMTAETQKGCRRSRAAEHLNEVQFAVFNQALSANRESKEQLYAIKVPMDKVLLFAGDANGQLGYIISCAPDEASVSRGEVRLALMHVQDSLNDGPLVHFLSASLVARGDREVVTSVKVLDLAELFSRTVEVEYRRNDTTVAGLCPLSRKFFKPRLGRHAFLPGVLDPVNEENLPPGGIVDGDPSRARWTVGDVQAYMVAKWRAARTLRKTPPAPASRNASQPCPFCLH